MGGELQVPDCQSCNCRSNPPAGEVEIITKLQTQGKLLKSQNICGLIKISKNSNIKQFVYQHFQISWGGNPVAMFMFPSPHYSRASFPDRPAVMTSAVRRISRICCGRLLSHLTIHQAGSTIIIVPQFHQLAGCPRPPPSTETTKKDKKLSKWWKNK